MANNSMTRITTGQQSWDAGVNSDAVPTIASAANPNGLKQNNLAWLINGTVRGGTISPRAGFDRLIAFTAGMGLFQEASIYEPNFGFPYIVAQIAGRTFTVLLDPPYTITEVTIAGDPNPPNIDQAWMCQGEQFLVIQDGVSLPLIWDGVFLRRSLGPSRSLGVVGVAAVTPAVGAPVVVTLTSPYIGANGELVYVNGKQFLAYNTPANFITIINLSSPATAGSLVPAGSTIYTNAPSATPADSLYLTIAPFVIPAVAAPGVQVILERPYTGPVPNFQVGITNTNPAYEITAAGAAPLGPNQVYLVNISGIPTDPIAIGAIIGSDPEIPTAECMDYYMGRLWLAKGREYLAGDIVRGPSGTAAYGYRDSILKMTENTYLSLGGTFIVPTNAGNIRALKHPANLDTALGEGQLLVFTRRNIYSVNVVPTRAQWAALSEPIQRVALINFGTTSDRSVASVNGDLFFQSVDGVRSLVQAIRFFQQWGQVPISIEENRAIALNDRSLLRFGSGIEFDNRLLETALPFQTDVGVCHQMLMPLNFDLISTLAEKKPPAWEGAVVGLDFLRLLKCDYGGRQRAFTFAREGANGIALWEVTNFLQEDENVTGNLRVSFVFETPSFTWNDPFQLKELDTLELWLDELYGQVEFTVEFRPDQHPCWEYWHKWTDCAPRNECEDPGVVLSCDYPQQRYKQQYRATVVLPKPPRFCENSQHRPIDHGYSFQFRITIKGHVRIRGLMVHAFERSKAPYDTVKQLC
jgi:hypothetical protein